MLVPPPHGREPVDQAAGELLEPAALREQGSAGRHRVPVRPARAARRRLRRLHDRGAPEGRAERGGCSGADEVQLLTDAPHVIPLVPPGLRPGRRVGELPALGDPRQHQRRSEPAEHYKGAGQPVDGGRRRLLVVGVRVWGRLPRQERAEVWLPLNGSAAE